MTQTAILNGKKVTMMELAYLFQKEGMPVCAPPDMAAVLGPSLQDAVTYVPREKIEMIERHRRYFKSIASEFGNGRALNHRAKLTPDSVAKIRMLRSEGVSFKELSRIFRVSSRTIEDVVYLKTWKFVQAAEPTVPGTQLRIN